MFLVPWIINVQEGENVTLPCYGDTRQDAKDVTWKKDGPIVVQQFAQNSLMNFKESRFILSEKCFQDGDLSLEIISVNRSDAGLYRCFLNDESREGEPSAVFLHVHVHGHYNHFLF